jgi:hypothetical protein
VRARNGILHQLGELGGLLLGWLENLEGVWRTGLGWARLEGTTRYQVELRAQRSGLHFCSNLFPRFLLAMKLRKGQVR